MPLFKTITVNKNTSIYLWKITESLEFLSDIELNTNSKNRVAQMKSLQHQKGYLSVRFLLKQAGYKDNDLYYETSGKPLLKDGKYISISHSYDFSAIIVSSQVIGIDIEQNRDKILRIAHRFSNFPEETNIQNLTKEWAAKEALYKIHPSGGMSFKEDLKISPFSDKKTTGTIATPELNNTYQIFFEDIENYSLAYAIPYEKQSYS